MSNKKIAIAVKKVAVKYHILVLACVFGVAFLNDEVYSAFSHRNDLPFTSRGYSTKGSRNLAGAGIRSHSHVHDTRLWSTRRESFLREDA